MDFVYLVIRDLDSYDGPEIDVFTDPDLAHEWAAALRASGREIVEQEQGLLSAADIADMKQTLAPEDDATPATVDVLVESGQAAKARRALDALGISYTENPWQPGIRQFVVDASDPEKLRQVFA